MDVARKADISPAQLARLEQLAPEAVERHAVGLGGRLIEGLRSRGFPVLTPEAPAERANSTSASGTTAASGLNLCDRALASVAATSGVATADAIVSGEAPASPQAARAARELDEVLAPLSQPRYVIPRLILPPPAGPAAAAGLAR